MAACDCLGKGLFLDCFVAGCWRLLAVTKWPWLQWGSHSKNLLVIALVNCRSQRWFVWKRTTCFQTLPNYSAAPSVQTMVNWGNLLWTKVIPRRYLMQHCDQFHKVTASKPSQPSDFTSTSINHLSRRQWIHIFLSGLWLPRGQRPQTDETALMISIKLNLRLKEML